MAQATAGLRALLGVPAIYRAFQRAVGGDVGRRIAREHIRPQPGERLLDVGCGTGGMLRVMPDVNYVGVDISADYIADARRRHGGRGTFIDAVQTPHRGLERRC